MVATAIAATASFRPASYHPLRQTRDPGGLRPGLCLEGLALPLALPPCTGRVLSGLRQGGCLRNTRVSPVSRRSGAGENAAGPEEVEETAASTPASSSSTTSSYASRPNWRRKYRQALPFNEARRCVQAIGFDSREDWDEWVADGKSCPWLGPYMPNHPEEMYAEEWQGWDDFLGLILDFEEARKVVAELGLQTQEDWYQFVEEDAVRLRELRLPARPAFYYSRQWQGYDHWLGLPERTIYVPSEWGLSGE